MSRFIDMDKLVLPKGTVNRIQERGVPAILDWIAEQESIEVVRCKDCKYHLFSGSCDNDYISRQIEHCGCYPDFNTPDDFFCKYGERRETE